MEEENKEELIAGAPMRFQDNAVNAEPVFPSPFNSKIGNSTIDLSDKAIPTRLLPKSIPKLLPIKSNRLFKVLF